MSQLVPAARQLITQVQHFKPNAKAKSVGDPDGIGVLRSISFDKATSKWLTPILEVIADERIASIDTTNTGTVVTFVADTRSDHRTEFPLGAVFDVLSE